MFGVSEHGQSREVSWTPSCRCIPILFRFVGPFRLFSFCSVTTLHHDNMSAKFVVKTLFAALIVAQGVSSSIVVLNFDTFADSKCYHPKFKNCNISVDPCHDYQVVAWFYNARYRSCSPLWGINGTNKCVENHRLPKTKRECEDACGQPCMITSEQSGICMFPKFCLNNGNHSNLRECGDSRINCCPRDYNFQLPNLNSLTTIDETI